MYVTAHLGDGTTGLINTVVKIENNSSDKVKPPLAHR